MTKEFISESALVHQMSLLPKHLAVMTEQIGRVRGPSMLNEGDQIFYLRSDGSLNILHVVPHLSTAQTFALCKESVTELHLSHRILRALIDMRIETLGHLVEKTKQDLAKIETLCEEEINVIEAVLRCKGLALKQ